MSKRHSSQHDQAPLANGGKYEYQKNRAVDYNMSSVTNQRVHIYTLK